MTKWTDSSTKNARYILTYSPCLPAPEAAAALDHIEALERRVEEQQSALKLVPTITDVLGSPPYIEMHNKLKERIAELENACEAYREAHGEHAELTARVAELEGMVVAYGNADSGSARALLDEANVIIGRSSQSVPKTTPKGGEC